MDLLGGGLDQLLGGGGGGGMDAAPAAVAPAATTNAGLLGDIFGVATTAAPVSNPKVMVVTAASGKGMECSISMNRRNGQVYMDLTISNKAMAPMSGVAIQLNKNSFGLIPASPLQVPTPLNPGVTHETSLPLNNNGPVQRMDPLTNIQVAIKNNLDVFYFAHVTPMNVYFTEDGQMDKRVFLATWKDIPAQNEQQYSLNNIHFNTDTVSSKLSQVNIFTIAKRNVEGQDMLYQSIKLTNGIWVLAELKIKPGDPTFTLSLKSRAMDV